MSMVVLIIVLNKVTDANINTYSFLVRIISLSTINEKNNMTEIINNTINCQIWNNKFPKNQL